MEPRRTAILLGTALLCYAPGIMFGWGSDGDSVRIAETGRVTIATGVYTPSRYPGFPVHEIPAALLAHLGGAALSNAGTMVLALLGVYAFIRITDHYALPHRTLLALAFILNPAYWTMATYTIDYVWSLALLLAGFALVCHRRYVWAGVVLGLATGSRASSLAFALTLLAYQFAREKQDRRAIALSASIATGIGVSMYASILRQYGFLQLSIGDWSAADYFTNFVYGNLMLIGPQTMIWLLVAVPAVLRVPDRAPREWRHLAWFALVIIAGYEVLFLWAPLQVGYLLPALPCILLLVGMAGARRRSLVVLWLLLSASSSIVNVNVVSVTGSVYFPESVLAPFVAVRGPSLRGRTTALQSGVFVRWGYVVSDLVARKRLVP